MHITRMKDFITGIALLLFLTAFYVESKNISDVGGNDMGPLFFPYLMMAIVAILSLVMIFKSISFGVSEEPQAQTTGSLKLSSEQIVFIALFFIYVFSLPFGGYMICTLGYLGISMIYFGKRAPKWIIIYIITTICATAFVYYIFSKAMHLMLP